MPPLQELIHVAISAGLTLLIFSFGLQASADDALYVLRRPRLLLRSLIPIVVIVPLFAASIISGLDITHEVAVAIMLMAISPFPPFLPNKQLKLGVNASYSYGLLVAVSLCSVVTVPASLAILSALYSLDVSVAPSALAKMIFASILAPMGIGMLLHRVFPVASLRSAPWASRLAALLLVLGIVPVAIFVWPAIMKLIGNGNVLAIEAVVVVGLLAGHWMGGPDAHDRAALATAAATRHPGIALLLAGAIAAPAIVKAAVLLFLVVGTITAIPYQLWFKHRYPATSPA